MKTRSERLRHRRSVQLEFLENRSLLSQVVAPAAEVRSDHDLVPFKAVPFKARTDYTPSEPGSLTFVGTGTGTHTGKFTAIASVTTYLDLTGYSVSAVVTAANGDQINFSGNATFTSFSSTTATATGTGEITGGTGRFEGATGDVTFNDNFTVVNGTTIVSDHQTTEGSISF